MVNLLSWITKGQFTKGLSVMLFGLVLVSCTDTDGPPKDLIGTAAAGAATQGMVFVMDATGSEISKTINADGFFRIDARGMTAPFILKTVADNGVDPDLYSYVAEIADKDATVNITPLSNLALYILNGNADPASLYSSWESTFGNITAAVMTDAQATVNANLSTQYTAFSLNPFTFDFIGTRFLANGTSFDGLLDEMTVDLSAGISISVAGIAGALVFDPNIDITDYDIGGVGVASSGAYTLSFAVTVDTVSSSSLLLSINLPASSVPTPTGNTQYVEDTFATFYGSVGTIVINSVVVTVTVDPDTLIETTDAVIDATITTLDGDVNYIATYTYTPNP